MHAREYYNKQLQMVELYINLHKKELYFDRKFELHSLSQEQRITDVKSLKFLLNLTTTKKDVL